MWRYRYVLGTLFGGVIGLLILKELHVLSGRVPEIGFIPYWWGSDLKTYAILILLGAMASGLAGAGMYYWRDRYRDASRRIKALSELSFLKTDLLSVAAHEIRTPITSIEWGIKMIIGGEYGGVSSAVKEVLYEIYRSTLNLRLSANDFLTVARLERNVLEIDLKPIEVSQLEKSIRKVMEDFKTQAEAKKLDLEISADCGDNFSLAVDINRLTEVVRNFLENAINYSLAGGKVSAVISTAAAGLTFSVADSSIGIRAEDQTKIFQKLFRAENARRKESTGTGLGLYLSKKFIEAHGGRIWFESKEGEGSRFSFFLPRKAATPTEEFFKNA